MADDTDIDAMVLKARAQAREFNETLEKLEGAGVEVSVVAPTHKMELVQYVNRVELGLRFRPRRSLHASAAQVAPPPNPLAGLAGANDPTLARMKAMQWAKEQGIINT